MKQFSLFRNYHGIFDKELYPQFEALMEDHLDISDEERESIVRNAILNYFTPSMMAEQLNYAYRKDYDLFRYKYIDGQAYLVEYDEKTAPRSQFTVSTHFIHKNEEREIKEVIKVPNEYFKELFINFAWEWFYSRTMMVMKQIIFHKCEVLDREKEAGIMEDTWIIRGDYFDLVDTYKYLQSL